LVSGTFFYGLKAHCSLHMTW